MEGERRSVNSELWHACAGPCVSLPSVGSLVVYFPQGHSEQVAASTQKEVDGHIPNYPNLQSQLVCQLHNITLHADAETDEVFAQMTLQPVNEQDRELFLPPDVGTQNRQPTDFFCKTLTASDTSTHGGFSVPRRAAEKVFPPLDFTKQPPAQELRAKDLHEYPWTFRHIYRGQPKRHLLTTGWSVFVSAKRLVAGDSVLFIRDDKGQLLLGIRRANRQQTMLPSSVLSSDSMHIGVLAAAAHAAATSSRFQVFYNPRTSPSEFVIPLAKYKKAVYCTQISVGLRFRMVFETEESTLRRYMGTITGIGDLDPIRWPGSKWRNLEVGWDESTAGERPRRVSVWEIEPVSSPFLICPPFSLKPKRPQHLGLLGDEGDMEASMKRCLTWLRGENSGREFPSPTLQSLGGDIPWMQLQQQSEALKSEIYGGVAAPPVQDTRSMDASKLLLQSTQNVQSRLQQQRQPPQQQQEQQPSHILWPQSNVQQPNNQKQLQVQLTMPQAQMQTQPPLLPQNTPSAMQPSLPPVHSSLSHQAYPAVQNQQQQQQLVIQPASQLQVQPTSQLQTQPAPQLQSQQSQTSQQAMQATDISVHLLQQLHHNQTQGSLNLPLVRSCTSLSESDLAFVSTPASSNAFSLHNMIGKSHRGSSAPDDGQLSTLIQPNQNVITQQPQLHQPQSILLQQQQLQQQNLLQQQHSSAQQHQTRIQQPHLQQHQSMQHSQPHQQPQPHQQQTPEIMTMPSTLPQLEPHILGSWFPLAKEGNHYESSMLPHIQIGQSDTPSTVTSCSFTLPPEPLDNSVILPPTTGGLQTRIGSINKEVQGRAISDSFLGSFPSPSGSFTSGPSEARINAGIAAANGGLDEALLQRGSSWSQMPAPVRTFTKVHKSGSVGRSIDLSRLKGYDELRRELAHLFNIEGQLEDPQRSCWKLVFVDRDGDILLVGDDPWDEFIACVRAIKILSPAQVLQMNQGSFEQLSSLPMPQQTSSSSDDCQVWRDT